YGGAPPIVRYCRPGSGLRVRLPVNGAFVHRLRGPGLLILPGAAAPHPARFRSWPARKGFEAGNPMAVARNGSAATVARCCSAVTPTTPIRSVDCQPDSPGERSPTERGAWSWRRPRPIASSARGPTRRSPTQRPNGRPCDEDRFGSRPRDSASLGWPSPSPDLGDRAGLTLRSQSGHVPTKVEIALGPPA